MFQLFAARLFEQRVLTAFRQRIADERQMALLAELEDEKSNEVEREAKKQREAQKRKEKKEKQKQQKAEEKARKEAEKKAAENAAKALELQKQEEQKKRKEDQRRKKEAERKAQEEERLKKDAERARRQQEEREKQQEAEKKARESKAQEKKVREDARRKEREEKEAKEREAREKKLHADKQRKDREDKAKAEKDAQDKAKREAQVQATQTSRRSAPASAVALPPLQRNPSGFPSPHVAVATPAIPKAPTPVRARAGSQQGSKGSSPKTPQVQMGVGKSTSPLDPAGQPGNAHRKTILPKTSQVFSHVSQPSGLPSGGLPPPGLNPPLGFMQPSMNGFNQNPPPGMRPQHSTMFPNPSPQHMNQFRQPGPMSIPPGPPGMPIPNMAPLGRMYDAPPPFPQPLAPPPGFGAVGPPSHPPPGHGRQASGSSSTFELPIGSGSRQTAVQRPSSVKPNDDMRLNIDDLSHQLGSSVLLDDSDELLPSLADRRPPGLSGLPRVPPNMSAFGPSPMFVQPNQQRMDSFSALGSTSNTASSWGTPPSGLTFGQGPLSPGNAWNASTGGWPSANPTASPLGGLGLGALGGLGSLGTLGRARPIQLRTTVCMLFRQMLANKIDSYQTLATIVRAMDQHVKPPTDVDELLTILDTEGSEANGGGTFIVQFNHARPDLTLVRWSPPDEGKSSVGAIGQIGSPNPQHSVPVNTAPPPGLFPGLGAHHVGFHH